jgi:hypothetical protein
VRRLGQVGLFMVALGFLGQFAGTVWPQSSNEPVNPPSVDMSAGANK